MEKTKARGRQIFAGKMDKSTEMTMALDEDSATNLRGELPDQAALHGVLARIRDLGLILIAVHRLDGEGEE